MKPTRVLDAYARWFWYPLTDVFAAVTGLRRLQNRLRARSETRKWALVVELDNAGLNESAKRLAASLSREHS